MKEGSNLEEATFISIVMRMATGAYMALGKVENPNTGKKEVDTKMAEYLIDSLRVLKDKTEGNLNKEEEGYLSQVISDLEMNFIKEKENK